MPPGLSPRLASFPGVVGGNKIAFRRPHRAHSMLLRPVFVTAIAAAVCAASSALAQTPPATTTMPSVPASTCVKPEYPGRLSLTIDSKVKAFNRDYNAYRDCTNKYVDGT